MASTALAKINARVKQLSKKHPGKKRVTLQKQAGKEYKAGKLGGVRRKRVAGAKKHHKAHKKAVGSKRYSRRVGAIRTNKDTTDRKSTNITIGSVSSHLAAAKKKLRDEIGEKSAARLTAKTAKQKRVLAKTIREKVSLYKKL
jgi:hypothetical protein